MVSLIVFLFCLVEDTCAEEKLCKNGAECENTDDGYKCKCKAGFEGKDCESGIV